MKKILQHLAALLCVMASIASCNESGNTIYLDGFKASELMASTDNVMLNVDKSKDIVLSMAWKNPTLLSSDETKTAANGTLITTLQASTTEDFATTTDYSVTNLSKSFLGADLNALAKDLGLTPDQNAPIYFRIKSQMGANLDAAYSNVCKVNVTPYLIDMSYVNILNADKDAVTTYLYSANKDGIYTGYMCASAWMNFWAKENDGTVWGNTPIEGKAFVIDNIETAWNFWFPGVAGIYYTVLDTKAKEWKATIIKQMKLNGVDMTYDAPNYAWVGVVTTTADNSPIQISASGAEYSKETGTDDAAAVVETLNYSLIDGKMITSDASGSINIAKAGTYTVTVKVGEKSDLTYTIDSGNSASPEGHNTLCMFTTDGNSLLAIMEKVSDGVYTCKYKPAAWENFRFIYVGEGNDDKQTWYGSDPSNLFTLSSAEGNWNIWFKDDVTGGEVTVTADLNTMTWKYE